MDSGTVAGRYRLRQVIGTGGMSRVWLARDEILARDVAVKEVLAMPGLPPGQADLWSRTIAEGRTAARLTHPNVVRVYDVLFTGGRPWIVMEFVPSKSLEDVVRAGGPLPPDVTARVGLAVLDGLAAAHRAGVLHRDVKPPNVLIADDGRVLLGDFGVAVFHDGTDGAGTTTTAGKAGRSGRRTGTGTGKDTLLIASPSYVAPERVRDRTSSVETDLWSFGATMYWCVEGRPPYARGSTAEVLAALATSDPDPFERAGPLREVIDGLLRREPDERLTADQARALLSAVAPSAVAAGVRLPVAPLAATLHIDPASIDPAFIASTPAEPATAGPPATAEPSRPDPGAGGRPADAGSRPVARVAVAAVGLLLLAGGTAGLVSAARADASRAVFVDRAGTGTAAAARAAATCADGATPPGTAPLATPPTAAPPAAGDSVAAGSDGTADALPAGWGPHADPAGFRISRPAGWVRVTGDGIVCFLDPAGGRRLTVGVAVPAAPDRVASWRAAEQDLLGAGPPGGYTSIGIGPVVYQRGGADWEFTYDAGGTRWHTQRRVFGVDGGREFTLSWTTGDSAWAPGQATFRAFAQSFAAG